MYESPIRRLNWGCGDDIHEGWINSDFSEIYGIDICCDILDGLPLASNSLQYVFSAHALPMLAYEEQVPALRELHRVLEPGGVLRLVLPDLVRGLKAYEAGDRSYFFVDDADARSMGGKLISQLLWFGHSKMLFTYDFAAELVVKAGFRNPVECSSGETKSRYPEIVELDNREQESFFLEAEK